MTNSSSYLFSARHYNFDAMHDLTGFQRDLLYVISGLEKPKGLTVKAELDDYYGTEINHGRLYPNLDALVEKGLIEKSKKDDRTNEYTLTTRGHREIEARREWENELVGAEIETPAV